jgi:hypothetical protein
MGDDGDPRPPPALPLTIELPGAGSITIRVPTLADVEAIRSLYDELDPEDRHRRFFSAFSPDHDFVAGWVRAPETGGFRIVAEDQTSAIVADGGYTLLPNGDAEFDITVARPFRGWLGPYLLDVLLAHAAATGIPNLEAEVLSQNDRILALVKRRGYAVVGHDDHLSMRVVVGARTPTPSWPPQTERPRLLVEAPTGRWKGEELARSRGFDVTVCPGPPASRPDRCPVLRGEPCPLAAEADAVVVAFPTTTGALGEQLCRAHHTVHEHPVVVSEGAEPDADEVETVSTVMESLGIEPYTLPRRHPERPDPPD